MTHVRNNKRFPDDLAKFYASEILLALEYLHSQKIIYRDLKLENVLLDFDGHVKLADYGISKINIGYGDLTNTFCGTENYMAIEILEGRKYGLAVDWWAFGCLLYVMLTGFYPFAGNDFDEILISIRMNKIRFPPKMNSSAISLIQGLLVKNPVQRLGSGASGADEIRRHAYFSNVDWNAVLKKEVTPPFAPEILNVEDVSNFDSEFTVETPLLTRLSERYNVADESLNSFDFVSDWVVDERKMFLGAKCL
jgi:serine/threonine protein kinase